MFFLSKEEILQIHERSIQKYGGSLGFLNESALDSAIAAPEARNYYEGAEVIACAATYGYHITKAHAFVDGNKRVGAGSTLAFLLLNEAKLFVSQDEIVATFFGVADGSISRDDLEQIISTWVAIP
jgi:death-on-curing protein